MALSCYSLPETAGAQLPAKTALISIKHFDDTQPVLQATTMKFPALALMAMFIFCTGAYAKAGSHSVRGHITKKGSYVQPHHATNRDRTRANNWSHRGNANPYTGKNGTRN